MASQPVNFSSGLPETVLPDEPQELYDELARAAGGANPVVDTEKIIARHPSSLAAWAGLGAVAPTPVWRYAAFRVGYHRGLDALRAAGWRGSGYVRAGRGGNDAFLRCLAGLRSAADEIGEYAEVDRITTFLSQLDPGNG